MTSERPESSAASGGWIRGVGPSALLLLLLAAVDLAALWSIVSARADAIVIARADLELQTRLQAGAFEAGLADVYADLAFLAETAALRELPSLDRNAATEALIDFATARPVVARLALRPSNGTDGIVVGRDDGTSPPRVLAPDAPSPPGGVVRGRTRLGAGPGAIDAWVDPRRLLDELAPSVEGLELSPTPPPGSSPPGVLVVSEPVRDDRWSPPVRRWIVRREEGRLGSVEGVLSRLRRILVANAAVILLTLVLGAAGLRHVRRTARLEAEAAQEKRIRALETSAIEAERLASLGRMAAGIAHEINNPLEGMTNWHRLLQEDLEQGDVASARRMADGIGEGITRIAGVTRQVLSYADPRSFPREPVELRALVGRTLDFLRGSRSFDHLSLSLATDAEEAVVEGDATALSQLVLNLVLNAAELQTESGQVVVRVGGDGDGARIEVLDDGPGLPHDLAGSLFDPFVSGRGSTGLGLSLCRSIVESHGGRIEAEDRPEGGAVFRVDLPVNGSEQPDNARPAGTVGREPGAAGTATARPDGPDDA